MASETTPTLSYEPEYTGLCVVDPYNDFLSEGGKLYKYCRETLEAHNVVEHMKQIVAAARAHGIQVFVAPHHRWRESDQQSHWKTTPPIGAATARNQSFADGTWGGTFHPDFQPHPGDVVAHEHWLSSGFANTDLDLQLKKHGIRKVIVMGLRANTCIESTARFGMELGYDVTLIKDATAAFEQEGMHAAHKVNGPHFPHAIMTTEDLLALLPC